ncbi:DNA helicase IV [Vibrio galatheae]|uniref:DNA 3'-5' helicase n=1 Tax=Vibrio galatheae TaxID=579748 RepID=A0A0F4NPC8_9VIBR|nr:DNA helicase IV [Vibrio galatheae]KJY83936.1 DNA helicase IV [Vibrio galatheae]
MQLSANKTAKFFIQHEYYHIEVSSDALILSSETSEEHIPFNVWNGRVQIKNGLIWGGLVFFAHEHASQQRAWLVQGLPAKKCREFARNAVACYQQWHKNQCQQLVKFLPNWEEQVQHFARQPCFLTHSSVEKWRDQIVEDFQRMEMTLNDAMLRMPARMESIEPWINDPDEQLTTRNETWISNELDNWQVLFAQIESSPLNYSQKRAVLLNDDHNLVLAGAGSGKTSVLTARVAYLLQSHLARAEEILMLAFGKDAAQEMAQRLNDKIGLSAEGVKVNTFHQLGLQILNSVEQNEVVISPLALDDNQRQNWCIDWLKKHWMTPTNFKRWQKHLSKWPIAYLAGDDELGSHVENPKLIAWLEKQLMQLASIGLTKKEIQQRLVEHPEYTRLNSELALVWPCYQAWQQQLKELGHIDFNLMITRATHYVEKGKFISPWRYIMVDEYQDISPQRLALIEALCNQQEGGVLFAVGDDWQSIYQFAGSDVDLTTGFATRFPHSTVHHLDTTYRFNNRIGEVANRFIQQNPAQLAKQLNSHKEQKAKAVTLMPLGHVEKVLDQLNRSAKSTQSVLILGRNHYHKPELLQDWQKRFALLTIEFMTCHSSKGKEADFVFIVNVDEGQFPARVKALHIDGALTQSSDQFPYAEERRLFYVALTRAKKKVWVAYNGSGSSFVKELIDQDYPVIIQK